MKQMIQICKKEEDNKRILYFCTSGKIFFSDMLSYKLSLLDIHIEETLANQRFIS